MPRRALLALALGTLASCTPSESPPERTGVARAAIEWGEQEKLVTVNPAASDRCGWSVAVDGDRVVMGCPYKDHPTGDGVAIVFDRLNGVWSETQTLELAGSFDGGAYDIALDGDMLITGENAGSNEPGLIRVFSFNGTTWSFAFNYFEGSFTDGDKFGRALAMSTDHVVVGAPELGNGRVVVFDRSGTTLTQATQLLPTHTVTPQSSVLGFGDAVAIEGDTIVVGNPDDDTNGANAGAVYIFENDGGWALADKLFPPVGTTLDVFGTAVAIEGNRVFVGASGLDTPSNEAGAVYIFEKSAGTWAYTTTMQPDTPTALSYFGRALAVQGSRLVVAGGNNTTYLFEETTGSWNQTAELTTTGSPQATALDGDTIAIGMPFETGAFNETGATAVWTYGEPDGTACTSDTECISGHCTDGFCCDTPCGGDCEACAQSLGATADGTCTPLTTAVVCRTSTDLCDPEETCNGTDGTCPADAFAQAGTACRAATGDCDVAETCSGTEVACPADTLAPDATPCDDSDACTDADTCQNGTCEGTSVTCAPPEACQQAGTCQTDGTCTYVDQPDGTPCENGTCQNGTCAPEGGGNGGSSSGVGGAENPDDTEDGGCSCTAPGNHSPTPPAIALLFATAVVLLRRRRRRSTS